MSSNGASHNGSDIPDGNEEDDDDDVKPPPQTVTGRFSGSSAMPVEKTKDFRAVFARLRQLLGVEKARLAAIAALAVGSVTLTVLTPRILGNATDVIVRGVVTDEGLDFGELHRILGTVAVMFLASWGLLYSQSYILAGVVQRTMYDLRSRAEDKLNRLPLHYIDTHSRGDLLSRVTNDIDNFSQSLQQGTSQLLTSALTLIGVTTMMFLISPLLAVIAMVTVPVSVIVMSRVAIRARPRFIAQWRHTGALNGQAEEAFTGHAVVKAFGRQHEIEERFRKTNDDLYEAAFGAQFVSSLIQPAMQFLGDIQYVLVAVVGGLQVANGTISIGEVQAFIQYTRQFAEPLTRMASMANLFQSGLASLERVLEFLDADEQSAEPTSEPNSAPVRGHVVFDEVTFSYDPDTSLIDSLSLEAMPGQTVAIVGPTGAGKTTLVNLLMRFYELDGGRILLDEREIASIPRPELRKSFGMVLQDTWMFGGTIRDNIAYGNPDATEEQILEAARATYVDRFVHSLPDGYDSLIAEDGDNLSAGEKQLLTIARAFLADPAILILDEATSSVDTRTEVLIQEAMNALRVNRTSFVIAHRLSTIRGADIILVMDNGKIVEQGNHASLLTRGGAYHALYNAQFAGAITDVT